MSLKIAQNTPLTPERKGFTIVAKDKSADVFLYEEIGDGWMGGISAKRFADELNALGKLDTLNVYINSPGGSVFDGNAIFNTLKRNSARVVVSIDGLAASIASIIAMAGDEISMAANSMMMIHDPWTLVAGSAADLRATADMMDKVRETLLNTYADRTGFDSGKISDMMAAETWMTADEAIAMGFADKKTEELKMAAHFDLSRFKKAPKLAASVAGPVPSEPSIRDRIADLQLTNRKLRGDF